MFRSSGFIRYNPSRPSPVANSYDVLRQFSSDDFAKGSIERVKIEDIQLTEEEMGMFIDLHPFTNASPYTVVETMSLAKALILFREVGLRHLLVIPKIPGVSNFQFLFRKLTSMLNLYGSKSLQFCNSV